MTAKEQRDRILKIIVREGVAEPARLAEMMNVSMETIRKEFLIPEKTNQISRTRGGAVSRIPVPYSPAEGTCIIRDTQSEAMIPIILECASFYDHVLTTPDIVSCFEQKKGLASEYAGYQTSVATLPEELTEIYS